MSELSTQTGNPGSFSKISATILFSVRGSGIFADGYDAQTVSAHNIIVAKPGQTAGFCGDFNDLNPPIFKSNNVFASSGSAYGGICSDRTGLNGNISADPLFLDPSNDVFYLKPGSPVIDAGGNLASELPLSDFDGDPRILGWWGNLHGMGRAGAGHTAQLMSHFSWNATEEINGADGAVS